MLRFKSTVRIGHFNEHLARMFDAACVWSLLTRVDVEVNSIRDGAPDRTATTLHPFDLAVDFDTVGDKLADLELLEDHFRRVLPPQFDVVYEDDHVHVECDMRRGPVRRST